MLNTHIQLTSIVYFSISSDLGNINKLSLHEWMRFIRNGYKNLNFVSYKMHLKLCLIVIAASFLLIHIFLKGIGGLIFWPVDSFSPVWYNSSDIYLISTERVSRERYRIQIYWEKQFIYRILLFTTLLITGQIAIIAVSFIIFVILVKQFITVKTLSPFYPFQSYQDDQELSGWKL